MIRILAWHLYLPLPGEQSQEQIEYISRLISSGGINSVLIGGGWCFGHDYKKSSDGEAAVYSPNHLANCIRDVCKQKGVAVCRVPKHLAPPWWLNVVSTWGEVKQMHAMLRREVCRLSNGRQEPVELVFVGVPSHMRRAVWLWRCYNWLMMLVGRGVSQLQYGVEEMANHMGEDWAKGEWARNLIAYVDCFGVHLGALIHLHRRLQARGAYPRR